MEYGSRQGLGYYSVGKALTFILENKISILTNDLDGFFQRKYNGYVDLEKFAELVLELQKAGIPGEEQHRFLDFVESMDFSGRSDKNFTLESCAKAIIELYKNQAPKTVLAKIAALIYGSIKTSHLLKDELIRASRSSTLTEEFLDNITPFLDEIKNIRR